jgi:hypothetical protein
MPTNKLWIEHTERAAWQSVQALREKLAEAERRAERMAPPVQGWRELFAVVDAARERHALAGETYAELLGAAFERLARAETDRRALEARLAGEARQSPPELSPVRPLPSPRRPEDEHEDDVSEGPPSRSERNLFAEIRSRVRELDRERPRPDPNVELSEIETRLADLPELDSGEILDIAADLAALALHLRPEGALDDD